MSYVFRKAGSASAALLAFSVGAGIASAKEGSCTDPVVFGTTISATGQFSVNADRWVKMTQVFEQEINNDGGIKLAGCGGKSVPLKFVIYDDQSVPATAVNLTEKLITEDKVDVIVGPDWTPIGFAVSPIPEKHKVPEVMGNATALRIYDRGFKYLFGAATPSVLVWSDPYFDLLAKQSARPRSIFFVVQDNLFTKDIVTYASKRAEETGIKVVGNEIFPADAKDFTAIVLRLKAANPDVIYISSFDGPALPLINQMKQLHVTARSVHSVYTTGNMIKAAGKNMEGITGVAQWIPGVKTPYSDLIAKVLKESDVDWRDYLWTVGRLNAYILMLQAVEKAGVVDREKIREALATQTFKSPVGDVKFDGNGYAKMRGFVTQVQDGNIVAVGPEESVTGRMKYPSPGWQ